MVLRRKKRKARIDRGRDGLGNSPGFPVRSLLAESVERGKLTNTVLATRLQSSQTLIGYRQFDPTLANC